MGQSNAAFGYVHSAIGARRGLPGAEAVLRLRAPVANRDLDPYLRFHAAREHERTYPDPQKFALTA